MMMRVMGMREIKKILRRSLRRALLLVLHFLPGSVKGPIFRRLLRIEYQLPTQLQVRLAETTAEMEQAFKILHDAYVAEGLVQETSFGIRVTKYHALPTTSLVVAVLGKRVVGTLTIIQDSFLGLPIDHAYDISEFRIRGNRLIEVSALAVTPEFRKTSGTIFLPLTNFMFRYCKECLGADYILATTSRAHAEFYEAILLFKRLGQRAQKAYTFVRNESPSGVVLNVRTAEENYRRVYKRSPKERNLFHYYVEERFPELSFPRRKYFKAFDSSWTAKSLEYFFKERTDSFHAFSGKELMILRASFPGLELSKMIPRNKTSDEKDKRKQARFLVNCAAKISSQDTDNKPARVLDVARDGFRAVTEQTLILRSLVKLSIEIAKDQHAHVLATPMWTDNHGTYGFCIMISFDDWNDFIFHQEEDLKRGLVKEAA